jgi:hypothetical protein
MIWIFASKSDPEGGFGRAKSFAQTLNKNNQSVTFVDRLSGRMPDLMKVAKHRIVRTPSVVVTRGERGHELARMMRIPAIHEIEKVMELCH